MNINLDIKVRNELGKKEVRKIRHEGIVPGVVYGANEAPVPVSVNEKELLKVCYTASFLSNVFDVKLGKEDAKIIVRSIDFHPVTDAPLHIDFQRIAKGAKVKLNVPVEFINEDKCPAIKKGALLNVIVFHLESFCDVDAIPAKIVVDLSGKEIGASMTLDSIELPKGLEPVHKEKDNIIATLVGAKGESDSEGEEAVAAE